MKLRIDEDVWLPFRDTLLRVRDRETAGVVLCEVSPSGTVLRPRRLLQVPEDGYAIREIDRIQISPLALNRLVREAREKRWAVITIHTHPQSATPWFSWADDAGDARLMPSFQAQIPNSPHGSAVLTPSGGVVARTFDEASAVAMDVTTVGRTVQHLSPVRGDEENEAFERQRLALGAEGHRILKSLRVGIVGLGGIGSVVAAQLVHLGVGQLVLVDGDVVEASNLSRIVGACRADAQAGARKVEVAARYASSTGLPVSVSTVPTPLVPGGEQAKALAACDVVFSCVDRHQPRAVLNRMSYRWGVPVIDTGTAFRVGSHGALTGDAGRVVLIGPGRPCMACGGLLDPDRLREEALSSEERAKLLDEGYIQGAAVEQPSVMPFNTMVAGAAVIELLRLVAGFGSGLALDRLRFSFSDPAIRRVAVHAVPECGICGSGGCEAPTAASLSHAR